MTMDHSHHMDGMNMGNDTDGCGEGMMVSTLLKFNMGLQALAARG